jgi:hypothetical protein
LDEAAIPPRYSHIWQVYDLTNGEVLAKDPGCFSRFSTFVEQAEPDVVMLEHPWLWPAVKQLPAASAWPVIYNSYNLEAPLKCRMLHEAGLSEVETIAGEIDALERDLVGAAAAVSATTEADAEAYRRWTTRTVVVAGNGTERRVRAHLSGVLPDPLKPIWRYLLFVASAHPPNGAGFADLVLGGLTDIRPHERIVVAGSVSHLIEERLLDRGWRSLPRGRLVLLGEVSSFALDCLIENAAGMLLPITYGGGSNLKTPEALLARRPIIATSRALRGWETFSDLPGVVIADTPTEFVAGMQRVLSKDICPPPPDERLDAVLWDRTLQPIVQLVRVVVETRLTTATVPAQGLSSARLDI